MNQRYYSNVYWHFTGSATNLDGTLLTKPADITEYGQLKTLDEATDVLVRIMRSRTLLATSVERISDELETEPFCCVTDIPLKDLALHAINYGKVAIGFRAGAIHHCFVPVLYLSKDNLTMRNQLIPALEASSAQNGGYRIEHPSRQAAPETSPKGKNPFLNLIKITDFGPEPDHTFYSEREWRHIGSFPFETNDVEAVIAPAEKLPELRRTLFDELGYPATLSLFAWEFLEQA